MLAFVGHVGCVSWLTTRDLCLTLGMLGTYWPCLGLRWPRLGHMGGPSWGKRVCISRHRAPSTSAIGCLAWGMLGAYSAHVGFSWVDGGASRAERVTFPGTAPGLPALCWPILGMLGTTYIRPSGRAVVGGADRADRGEWARPQGMDGVAWLVIL